MGYSTYTTKAIQGEVGTAGLLMYYSGSTAFVNSNFSGYRIIGSGTYFAAT